ncbi:FAD-dependent oxidoreductase [Neptunomonas qingdaonensis]|uniref:3-(3-hydroxy-phenyl)propionate hydroxylase n=1 Tax=Neptunomonas qingdaonensis TaxID=1045558 RepID=A0A1I2R0D3_9GAMM|nr:FAD-dependent oxidoreductase [Neptunomonas qingdaonensis]SFG32969.1 3-(3-hydroxy-phenyl)propionate hydroxylase [Neptunomonas qingdaonensis]
MLNTYTFQEFNYARSTDQDAQIPVKHPVVVVGAGPMGLAAGIDLAQNNVPVIILDDNNTVSVGSRAVCYAKRFLDISDRLGVGQRLVDKGVTWNIGKVFLDEEQIYSFNMLPEEHHRRPGFINLQQYYMEEYYVDRLSTLENADMRWKNKVVNVVEENDVVTLTIATPEGEYQIQADYVIACDGANSKVRAMCGLESKGQVFHDRFLIADVVMDPKNFPPERWFWFNPPFHDGQSTLLHRQADNVWRIDFDLGWDADPEQEKKAENIIPRVRAFLGEDVEFELEWASVYTFTCRRMKEFRKGRIFFAGDAAHQVSPFGARGANSGIEDIDNLAWKIKLVLEKRAPAALLDSYSTERSFAADENILNSTRSTDFITPKSKISRVFRDAVLKLAKNYNFARPLVNSGRLSVPPILTESPLNTADSSKFACKVVPGAPCTDGPVVRNGQDDFLLTCLGNTFNGLLFVEKRQDLTSDTLQDLATLAAENVPVNTYIVARHEMDLDLPEGVELLIDKVGAVTERLDAKSGTFYLLRPDQLVTARMRQFDQQTVIAALDKALGK